MHANRLAFQTRQNNSSTHIPRLVHHFVEDQGQHHVGGDAHAGLRGVHLTNDLQAACTQDVVGRPHCPPFFFTT